MLKKILLILSLASITILSAQSSRVNSLQGVESSYTVGSIAVAPMGRVSVYDPADVMIFPHLANQYTDFINIFYAGDNSYSGFATFNIMPGLSIGMADFKASKQIWGVQNNHLVDNDGNPVSILTDHTYSIFAAYNLGTMDLGLSLNYWSSNAKQEVVNIDVNDEKLTNSATVNSSIFSLRLSLGMDLGSSMGFDSLLNVDFGGYTNEMHNSAADPKTKQINDSDAYMNLSLGGRFFMGITNNVKLTSWAFLDYANEGYTDSQYNGEGKKVATVKHERSFSIINLGSAFEIKTASDKLIVSPSFGILMSSFEETSTDLDGLVASKGSKNEQSLSRLAVPYVGVSIEYNVKKWLTIYSGYNKVVTSDEAKLRELSMNNDVKQQDTTTTVNQDRTTSNFAMGLSLQNDTMKFIASLNKALLLNGPNFISGTNAPMFISATFQWNFGTPKETVSPIKPSFVKTSPAKVTPKKETKVEKVIEEEETKAPQTDEEEEDSL